VEIIKTWRRHYPVRRLSELRKFSAGGHGLGIGSDNHGARAVGVTKNETDAIDLQLNGPRKPGLKPKPVPGPGALTRVQDV